MIAEQITAWRTSDGKVFTDRSDAKKHETYLALEHFFAVHSICRGGEWSADMIISTLCDNLNSLREIFNED